MKTKIRKSTDQDAKIICDIVNSQKKLYASVLSPEEIHGLGIGKYTPSDFKNEKNGAVILVDNTIVGHVSWYVKPNNVAWISMLHIDLQWQRNNLGSKLLKYAENEIKQAGAKAIALETQKKFTWAKKFYLKNGYKIIHAAELTQKPFTNTLQKPPLERTTVFGKIL